MAINHLRTNVHELERAASLVAGGLLLLPLLRTRSLGSAASAVAGAGFILRGLTGHCELYHALGVNTETKPARQSVEFTYTVSVAKPVNDTFAAWHSYERFPGFMKYVEEVDLQDRRKSHWKVQTRLGPSIEWDAVSRVNDVNHSIAWKTTESSVIQHSGNIKFVEGANPDSTDITVYCRYHPLGGRVVAKLVKALHVGPEELIREDLDRFKQCLESGEITATPRDRKSDTRPSTGV